MSHWSVKQIGAQWRARLWSPSANAVSIAVGKGRPMRMDRGDDGFWETAFSAEEGEHYSFIVDEIRYPDPASRLQVSDVHGPSRLVSGADFEWAPSWKARPFNEYVLYELHIGTFTPAGTFRAAADKMGELAKLGFTAIEIMPVSQFSGSRGWGYDGVLPFAPHPIYGSPNDLRHLVNTAQHNGICVVLDLVMNHFGPDGAYLHTITPEFFDPDRHTPWGAAIDFSRKAVRQFWIDCALMWLEEYRLDGLRLDAVHQIRGEGAAKFLMEVGEAVRKQDLGRPLHLIVEDERNEPTLRGSGLYAASWNDDFHHAVHTSLTGESQDYYVSFAQDPIGDLARALERGHIEEGQPREGRDTPRGSDCAYLPVTSFINAIQTHDQVGNRAKGERLLTLADENAVKTAYALLLTAPYTPMIFMGEERGSLSPFQFFADYEGDFADALRNGRVGEFAGIAALGEAVPDPIDPATFQRSRLDWSSSPAADAWLRLTQQVLAFRKACIFPLTATLRQHSTAHVVGEKALTAHWEFEAGELIIDLNFGEIGQHAPRAREPDFALFDLQRDPYALAAWSKLT
ncbi:malto-oligosyltrehalose trehalohydrolase [Devosia sp. J2-20]|jgi:maltooligosyltrehalose trehalohydrolase|uniref:malto-oligosyltrehalose trehalohydrolase n=1 Tax=Devosia sp. J2-20 TaxID=3026161 RepID=UPI00249A6A26|nr:malto-oligosyltrehalose trehalohydrolase [Devosia sp. J2-20]WDQ98432.1 malto-oligosyltrehalose trehalohydrolase [Devosia sp. J2-20]